MNTLGAAPKEGVSRRVYLWHAALALRDGSPEREYELNPAFPSPPVLKPALTAFTTAFTTAIAAQAPAGQPQGPWQNGGLNSKARNMPINGLTPGQNYVFQVRAIGGSTGYSDWSMPVGHMGM